MTTYILLLLMIICITSLFGVIEGFEDINDTHNNLEQKIEDITSQINTKRQETDSYKKDKIPGAKVELERVSTQNDALRDGYKSKLDTNKDQFIQNLRKQLQKCMDKGIEIDKDKQKAQEDNAKVDKQRMIIQLDYPNISDRLKKTQEDYDNTVKAYNEIAQRREAMRAYAENMERDYLSCMRAKDEQQRRNIMNR